MTESIPAEQRKATLEACLRHLKRLEAEGWIERQHLPAGDAQPVRPSIDGNGRGGGSGYHFNLCGGSGQPELKMGSHPTPAAYGVTPLPYKGRGPGE